MKDKIIVSGKLKAGDEIRVIAPSSFSVIGGKRMQKAKERLEEKGFKITFSDHYKKTKKANEFGSWDLQERAEDINDAFKDKKVKAIIPATGGFNANQILPLIDYGLISANPKIFCGYSDISVLSNAIFAKTGLITYSGPNFISFAINKGMFDFTYGNFIASTSLEGAFNFIPSEEWVDNKNAYDETAEYDKNTGPQILNEGNCTGRLVGGNLCSFNLLQGTRFMPDLTDKVVFVEDDFIFSDTRYFMLEFERNLVSLIQHNNFSKVKGFLIGRFEKQSNLTVEVLKKMIQAKADLFKIPVIANLDFGHTSPIITLPIGGMIEIKAASGKCSIKSR